MGKITKIIFTDNIKDKVVVIYLILLALLSWTSLLLQDNASKGALTELNIILSITPLMSLLYTVTYLYDSHDFIVLLLSQPLKRQQIWRSLYIGVSSSLHLAFLIGAGIPMLLYTESGTALILIVMGCVTTQIFVSLAFLTTMLTSEKTRGIGMMGYGGAAFKEFLGATGGIIISSLLLLLWIILPYVFSSHIFKRKDL